MVRALQVRPGLAAALVILLLCVPASATGRPAGPSDDVIVHAYSGTFSESAWRLRPTGACLAVSCSDGTPWVEPESHWVYAIGEAVHTVVFELVYAPDTPLSRISLTVWCERDDVVPADCAFSGFGTYQRIVIDTATSAGGHPEHDWHFDVEAAPDPHVDAVAWAEAAVVFEESFDVYVSAFSGDAVPGDDYTAVPG